MTFPKTSLELKTFVDDVIDHNQSVVSLKSNVAELKSDVAILKTDGKTTRELIHEIGILIENVQKEMRLGFDSILHLFEEIKPLKPLPTLLDLTRKDNELCMKPLKEHTSNKKIHLQP